MVWAFLVAVLNDYTCILLVRAAAKGTPDPTTPSPRGSSANLAAEEERGGGGESSSVASAASDFEELAFAAGGPVLKLVAQLALCVLLLGSMCSNLAVIAEASSRVLSSLSPTDALSHPLRHTAAGPQPLGGDGAATSTVGGAVVMLLVMGLIITPLCATRNMTALHHVAGGGALLLAGLLLAVVSSSVSHTAAGWEASMSPSSRVPGASASQAFVVLSFAFFVQPMLLPLLRELSESSLEQRQAQAVGDLVSCTSGGRNTAASPDASTFPAVTAADRLRAAEVLELATHVTMALALVVYALIGVCGVVAFGGATSEDILLNFAGPAGIVLDASMVLYLAVCFAPTCHALRRVIYGLWDGPAASCLAAAATALRVDGSGGARSTRVDWSIHFRRVAVLNVASAGVALFVPRSETLFAITGAVGVSVVCYLFPLLLHMRLVRYRGVHAGEAPDEDVLMAGTPSALPSAASSLFRGDARGLSFALRWLDAWALPVLAVGACTWLSVSGLQNTLHAR